MQTATLLPLQFLSIKESGRIIKLRFEDIVMFEASEKHINITIKGRKYPYIIAGVIKDLDEKLSPYLFCRVNRRCIVNYTLYTEIKEGDIYFDHIYTNIEKSFAPGLMELIFLL